ncbi:hypothetical protein ACA910_007966 [Epithemia clementina (nom. ined.)]
MGRPKHKPNKNGNKSNRKGVNQESNQAGEEKVAEKSVVPKNVQGPLVVCLILVIGFCTSWASRNAFGPSWEVDSGKSTRETLSSSSSSSSLEAKTKKTTFDDWASRVVETTASAAATPSSSKAKSSHQPETGDTGTVESSATTTKNDESFNEAFRPAIDKESIYKEAAEAIKQQLMQQDPSISEEEALEQAQEFLRHANLVFEEQPVPVVEDDDDEGGGSAGDSNPVKKMPLDEL